MRIDCIKFGTPTAGDRRSECHSELQLRPFVKKMPFRQETVGDAPGRRPVSTCEFKTSCERQPSTATQHNTLALPHHVDPAHYRTEEPEPSP